MQFLYYLRSCSALKILPEVYKCHEHPIINSRVLSIVSEITTPRPRPNSELRQMLDSLTVPLIGDPNKQ